MVRLRSRSSCSLTPKARASSSCFSTSSRCDVARVRLERILALLEFAAATFDVAPVVLGRDELVLAAREKSDEVGEEFAGFLETLEMLQFEAADVPAQQDLMIEVFEGLNLGVGGAQNFLEAEFVEGAEPDVFGALANRLHHAIFHLVGGFVGERQGEDVFAREIRVGFEKMADALGDDARLAGASAGDDEERAFAVLDGGALLGVEREALACGFRRFEGGSHRDKETLIVADFLGANIRRILLRRRRF